MTHPIHDHDDALAVLMDAAADRSLNSSCAEQGHRWQPVQLDPDRASIRCAECLWSPHTPVRAGAMA